MIAIASDHGGFELKSSIINSLTDIEFLDLGPSTDDRVDYPHFADLLCESISNHKVNRGILICGTGIGISIRANRYPGIRAALVYNNSLPKWLKLTIMRISYALGGEQHQLMLH